MKYKWYILALTCLTTAIAVAVPVISMSVLFGEIAQKLNLSVSQIGIVWGILSLGGLALSLPGGLLTDRFGPKKILLALIMSFFLKDTKIK